MRDDPEDVAEAILSSLIDAMSDAFGEHGIMMNGWLIAYNAIDSDGDSVWGVQGNPDAGLTTALGLGSLVQGHVQSLKEDAFASRQRMLLAGLREIFGDEEEDEEGY